MTLIDKLPIVESCCICIKDLKLAAILIGLFGGLCRAPMFFSPMLSTGTVSVFYNPCWTDLAKTIALVLAVCMIAAGAALLFASITLLMRIFMEKDFPTDWFVYAVFISQAVLILYFVISMLLPVQEGCLNLVGYMASGGIGSAVVDSLFMIYYAIVVNSYGKM